MTAPEPVSAVPAVLAIRHCAPILVRPAGVTPDLAVKEATRPAVSSVVRDVATNQHVADMLQWVRMPWRAETLKKLRQLRGLTQQQLADIVTAHRVTIAKLETGASRPGVDLLEALAKALRVSVTDLLR